MSYDPYLAVKFGAFDVALKAKINDLPQSDVDDLRGLTERNIPDPDDTLRRAVIGFVTQYELHRHDPARLHDLGTSMSDYIATLNMPVPPGADRRDLNG